MMDTIILDIKKAVCNFLEVCDIAESRSEAIQEIRRLRNLKTTWIGEHEMAVRREVDNLLDIVGG